MNLKTLVLTIDPVWPVTSGGGLRNVTTVMAARALGPVVVASLYGSDVPAPAGIEAVALGNRTPGACWRRKDAANPLAVAAPAEERASLATIIARTRPDVVVLEQSGLLNFVDIARHGPQAVVLDMHNVDSDLLYQIERAKRRTLWFGLKWGARARRARGAAAEAAAMATLDGVWACSDADAARLAALAPGHTATVIPNAVPPDAPSPPPQGRTPGTAPGLLYIGHLGYPPNVHAARRLADEVFPLVRRALPEARLRIAGRAPSSRMRRAALDRRPGVEVTANPPVLDDLIAASHFAVMPITEGGGTRIKALEALSAGLVVIGTPLALEGLGLVDGQDAVITDDPAAMAQAVVRLSADQAAYDRMAANGRRTAEARFSQPVCAALIAGALRDAVARRHPQA